MKRPKDLKNLYETAPQSDKRAWWACVDILKVLWAANILAGHCRITVECALQPFEIHDRASLGLILTGPTLRLSLTGPLV